MGGRYEAALSVVKPVKQGLCEGFDTGTVWVARASARIRGNKGKVKEHTGTSKLSIMA
jgi:hypothetical protein